MKIQCKRKVYSNGQKAVKTNGYATSKLNQQRSFSFDVKHKLPNNFAGLTTVGKTIFLLWCKSTHVKESPSEKAQKHGATLHAVLNCSVTNQTVY